MIDVYCLTSPSGRRYVGIASQGIATRWRSHVFDARHGSHFPLHAAIRKYGPEAFKREVLEVCESRDSAATAEQRLIVELRTHVRAGGYNATAGGDGTHGLTDEAKSRMRAASLAFWTPERRERTRAAVTPEMRDKTRATHLGRKRSAETRARLSAAHTGKHVSEETREKRRVNSTGKKRSAESKAKQAESMRRAWAHRTTAERAEVGNKITAGKLLNPAQWSAESRAKMGEASRERARVRAAGFPRLRIAPAWGAA